MFLRTYTHTVYEILIIHMRILGPTHEHLISTLEYYFYTLAANKIGFLLFKLRMQKLGLLDKYVANTSYELIEHCIKLIRDKQTINFEILFESLMITRDAVEATHAGMDQASKDERKLFDWALNVIILLLYVIRMQARHEQLSSVSVYIRDLLLARGAKKFNCGLLTRDTPSCILLFLTAMK